MRIVYFIIPVLAFLFALSSCERNTYTTNPADKLNFSEDTVQFDTIFTGIGSTTQYLTIINRNKKDIKVDDIMLARGANSVFRINVDGIQSNHVKNIEIPAGDSIFVFVEVTINPSVNDMVEQDSILVLSNGNTQDVDLIAFGQNVHLFDGEVLHNDTVWKSEKPILIYNSVLVDENVSLTIEEGTQLHFHYGSSLLVKGTLKVNGQLDFPVVFQGDRLEEPYDDVSGQWGAWLTLENGGIYLLGGIHFLTGSKYNEMQYAEVKNAIIGIRADSVVTAGVPTVKLDNCIIQHMNIAGLYGAGAHITATNSQFLDCGQYSAALLYGGDYNFKHCTFANYFSGSRQTSAVMLNNYFAYQSEGQDIVDVRDFNAYFGNCILFGNLAEELNLDIFDDGVSDYTFENCLIKTGTNINNSHFINVIKNENPKFVDVYETYDYHLDTLSPVKDAGKLEIGMEVPLDFDGNSRVDDNAPDLGAYERIE